MIDSSPTTRDARQMLRVGKPLERTLFLFSPPPGMESAEARRGAAVVLGVSVALVALSYAVLGWLTRHPQLTAGRFGFVLVILAVGAGFLLVPASLFRLLFGVPESDDGFAKFLRGCVGFALFVVCFVGSLVIYGQITG